MRPHYVMPVVDDEHVQAWTRLKKALGEHELLLLDEAEQNETVLKNLEADINKVEELFLTNW